MTAILQKKRQVNKISSFLRERRSVIGVTTEIKNSFQDIPTGVLYNKCVLYNKSVLCNKRFDFNFFYKSQIFD